MLHGNESWFTEAGTNCNAVPPVSERGRDPFAPHNGKDQPDVPE
jgi:hypothetical protein